MNPFVFAVVVLAVAMAAAAVPKPPGTSAARSPTNNNNNNNNNIFDLFPKEDPSLRPGTRPNATSLKGDGVGVEDNQLWKLVGTMGSARALASTVRIGDISIIFGGCTEASCTGEHSDKIGIFDPASQAMITAATRMPAKMAGPTTAVKCPNSILLVQACSISHTPPPADETPSVWIVEQTTLSFKEVPLVPSSLTPRRNASCVAFEGYVYIVGGVLSDGTVTNTVDAVGCTVTPNGYLNLWPSATQTRQHVMNAAVVSDDNGVYVAGGYDAQRQFSYTVGMFIPLHPLLGKSHGDDRTVFASYDTLHRDDDAADALRWKPRNPDGIMIASIAWVELPPFSHLEHVANEFYDLKVFAGHLIAIGGFQYTEYLLLKLYSDSSQWGLGYLVPAAALRPEGLPNTLPSISYHTHVERGYLGSCSQRLYLFAFGGATPDGQASKDIYLAEASGIFTPCLLNYNVTHWIRPVNGPGRVNPLPHPPRYVDFLNVTINLECSRSTCEDGYLRLSAAQSCDPRSSIGYDQIFTVGSAAHFVLNVTAIQAVGTQFYVCYSPGTLNVSKNGFAGSSSGSGSTRYCDDKVNECYEMQFFTTINPDAPLQLITNHHSTPSNRKSVTAVAVVTAVVLLLVLVIVLRLMAVYKPKQLPLQLVRVFGTAESYQVATDFDFADPGAEENDSFSSPHLRDALLAAGQVAPDGRAKYKVLGQVGTTTIYIVQRRSDNGKFAMKYISCEGDADRVEVMREFEVMRSLQGHHNVVRLVDMFMHYQFGSSVTAKPPTEVEAATEDKKPGVLRSKKDKHRFIALVMEHHPDGDIGQWIDQLPREKAEVTEQSKQRASYGATVIRSLTQAPLVPEPILTSVAYQLCSVLAHLHNQRQPIVHRDLKPENILVGDNAKQGALSVMKVPLNQKLMYIPIVVADFGVARSGLGANPYAAPECWRRSYTVKADMWSMGSVLIALATRRLGPSARYLFREAETMRTDEFESMIQSDLCGYSPSFVQMVLSLVRVNPDERLHSSECLQWFRPPHALGRQPITVHPPAPRSPRPPGSPSSGSRSSHGSGVGVTTNSRPLDVTRR